MSLNNEFDPIGGDGVPASLDAVPQEASPRIIITAQPIQWEAHRSGQQWTEGRYGYCITLESEDLPETPYVATLGEGDPETFATLAEAQAWCQRDIDATVARWAVVAAPPPQAAHNPCKLAECQGKPRCSMCLTADERRHERAAPKAGAGDVDAMARVLFDAWAKAEPEHSITKNPVSYMTTFCDMARAALAAPAERGVQWQPIETAPKDGTEVLLFAPGRRTYGAWAEPSDKPQIKYRNGFAPEPEWEEFEPYWASWDGGFTAENPPTHWAPAPDAPGGGIGTEGGPKP